uniref:hypothetical protein n=1 Tax=Candidatus Electrothrix sp. TaxID=2170559 RepID=UPI004057BEE8
MIQILRYLFVLRINRSLIETLKQPDQEILHNLAALIAENMGGADGKAWKKAARRLANASVDVSLDAVPLAGPPPWPIDAVLLAENPGTRLCLNELFFFELTVLSDRIGHHFILEYLLPALEQAGYSRMEKQPKFGLWGNYEIVGLFCAHGADWEPVIDEGQLSSDYFPKPDQWARDFMMNGTGKIFTRLDWIRPLAPDAAMPENGPDMPWLLAALERRMTALKLLNKGSADMDTLVQGIPGMEKASWQEAVDAAQAMPAPVSVLRPVEKEHPAKAVIGRQHFSAIPPVVLPWLELASILHLGLHTHYGYGGFSLA